MKPEHGKAEISISKRLAISGIVFLHLIAVVLCLLNVHVAGSPPAYIVSSLYSSYAGPYLERLGLVATHRYYAPDQGPYTQLWIRSRCKDRTIDWTQLPDRRKFTLWFPYQRHLPISMLVSTILVPSVEDPQKALLSELGRIILGSYARHLAHTLAQQSCQAEEIQIYGITHRTRSLLELEAGTTALDLGLHSPRYLGTYSANGILQHQNSDGGLLPCPEIPIAEFIATLISEDIQPRLPGNTPLKSINAENTKLPEAIAQAINSLGELSSSTPRAELLNRIKALILTTNSGGAA